ncbi:hypothetical protein RHGRI_031349 [Rhododendron griersonianum]|uniref:Uncharacterized protein n=1 Tax=Rhododendron griersonianum TaxID=479676 RepID=A0AAV6IB09_9ERIC|nr:hypothetical protein RHGRI_031349 [Rhododendron griersonianum]
MTFVLAASHRVKWFMESKCESECALRHTHCLPCAHEIAPYKMANIPLPIELIHNHWKRLSLLAAQNEGSMEETLLAHFDFFYNKFLNEDQYDAKVNYVNKMQELTHPKSNTLVEPKVNAQKRGRKSTKEKNAAKEQNSMRRDPLEFEHAQALQTPKAVKEKPWRNLKGIPKVGSPMPPIVCSWKKYRLSITKNWDAAYVAAIQKFNEINGIDVATKEVIHVN